MATNLGLWGEPIWPPTIYITNLQVCWEAVNEVTARLVVPDGDDEDYFIVTFDPQIGLTQYMQSLRNKPATDEQESP